MAAGQACSQGRANAPAGDVTVEPEAPGSAVAAGPAEADALVTAVRRLAHRLNNDLALPLGVLELLAERPDLPAHLRDLVQDARRGIAAATHHVDEFQGLLREPRAAL